MITHLVSAVSPPPINEEDQIPEITNTQCLKVAVFSQRLPPAVIHATQKGTNFLDDLKRRQDEGKLKGYGSGKGKGKLENNKTADEASAASLIGEKRIVELDNVKSPTTNESNQSATQTTIHMTSECGHISLFLTQLHFINLVLVCVPPQWVAIEHSKILEAVKAEFFLSLSHTWWCIVCVLNALL